VKQNHFLGDALGNVRQLVSGPAPDVKVMLTWEYPPYGEIVSQSGMGKTEYGFTGELQDGGLVHLRARDYAVADGQYLSRGNWEGVSNLTNSLTKWSYAYENPLKYNDTSGQIPGWIGVNNKQYVFSCEVGFIDFAHAGSSIAATIYELLLEERNQF
jgi:RHS repeat-associated protein